MKRILVVFMIGALGALASLFGESDAGAVQDGADKPQDGVEVLTRGPMHEAYAAPQSLDPKPSPIVPKKPPEPVPEMPPDQKPEGAHVVWISGYWAWDDDPAEFVWVSGFWRDAPPGKRWVPGHWLEAGGGWQWTSGFWSDQQESQITYVPAPPPTLENGPAGNAPAADQFYSPGSWVYVERQYRWRPGFWIKYRPDWVYVPAHYAWTPAGCVFIEGHWDYELHRRGLLFCPIRFTANVFARVGWRLLPRFIIYPEVFVGSLFIRADFHRYCFGDYFGPSYIQHGFVPWMDYRLGRNIPGPLFSQFAWVHRTEVNWERELRKLYDDRRLGLVPRPPRTWAQQQVFLRDLAEHKAIKIGEKNFAIKDLKEAERHLTLVSPLSRVDKKVIVLKTLTPAAHAEVLKTVEHHLAINAERKATETKLLKETPVFRPSDPHQIGKLPELPKHLNVKVTGPAMPVIPKHVEKVVPKFEPPKAIKVSEKPLHHGFLNRPSLERTAELSAEEVPEMVVRRSLTAD